MTSSPDEPRVTIADILYARGVAIGEARAEARGELKGRMDTLMEVIASRFPEGVESAEGAVQAGTLEQLRLWGIRVLYAETIEDIFA